MTAPTDVAPDGAEALHVVDVLRHGGVAALEGVSLAGAPLAGADLQATRLTYLDLAGADLRGSDLGGAELEHVNLSGAALSGAVLDGAVLRSVTLAAADLDQASLRGAWLDHVDLAGARLEQADLRGATLRNCRAAGAVLAGADLRTATLDGSSFDDADFAGARLLKATSSGASFRGARLASARHFHLTREAVAAVLEGASEGDPERLAVAASVRSVPSWCWDAWARYQRDLPDHLWAWAVDTFRRHPASGCLQALLREVRRAGLQPPLPDAARPVTVPLDQFLTVTLDGRTFAATRPIGPFGLGPDGLVGELCSCRRRPDPVDPLAATVEAVVVPLDPGGRAAAFRRIAARNNAADLGAPFAPRVPDGAEAVPPAGFWDALGPAELDAMDREEVPIRQELARLAADLPEGATVVDAGCSTGAALAAVGAVRPDLRLVGLDPSASMVAAASRRLSRFPGAACRRHDARQPLEVAADLCIVRCLAHTVVSAETADAILRRCLEALKPGGSLVLTSVMPPYHGRDDLEALGLRVVQTTARSPADGLVFPFYRAVAGPRPAAG